MSRFKYLRYKYSNGRFLEHTKRGELLLNTTIHLPTITLINLNALIKNIPNNYF